MRVVDLAQLSYKQTWALQEQAQHEVQHGAEPVLFLVEHPSVITFGRHPGVDRHLLANADELAAQDVEVVQSDRGGDITYHGPGQLVAYPIVRLADHGLSVSGYVHALERAVIATLAEYGIAARTDPAAIGVWVNDRQPAAKICAIGVRIRRGITMHGLALNVSTNLDHFKLIIPCGLSGKSVTSLQEIMKECTPPMSDVKTRLTNCLIATLGRG